MSPIQHYPNIHISMRPCGPTNACLNFARDVSERTVLGNWLKKIAPASLNDLRPEAVLTLFNFKKILVSTCIDVVRLFHEIVIKITGVLALLTI